LPLVCFSIASICTSNRIVPDVYVLTLGIDDAEIEKADAYLRSLGVRVHFHRTPAEDFVLGDAKRLSVPVVYLHLKLGEVVPDRYERVLCLDGDTRVAHDLAPLWEMDLQGRAVGAAHDLITFSGEPFEQLQQTLGLAPGSSYLNAGVLLIDLARWKDRDIGRRALEFALSFTDRCKFRDQCALNKQLVDDWIPLDPRWNFYTPHFPTHRTAFIHHFPGHHPWDDLKNRKGNTNSLLVPHNLWYSEVAVESPWPQFVTRCTEAKVRTYRKKLSTARRASYLAAASPKFYQWMPPSWFSRLRDQAAKARNFDRYVRENDPAVLRGV